MESGPEDTGGREIRPFVIGKAKVVVPIMVGGSDCKYYFF